MRHLGVTPETARRVVADLGWDVYRPMLRLSSLPARLVTRDPGRRLRWTIRALLFFPFSARVRPVMRWRRGATATTSSHISRAARHRASCVGWPDGPMLLA